MDQGQLDPAPERQSAMKRALVEHRSALLAYAKRHAPNGVEGEDLVSQTIERALERAHQVDENEKAWLYSVLRSRIADAYRLGARVRRRDAKLAQAEVLGSEVSVSMHDEVNAPMSCWCYSEFIGESADLDRVLQDPGVDALRRVAVEEQSAAEAAADLGISTGAFHVRLHRARKKAKAFLRDRCGISDIREARDCDCDSGCGSS